MMRKQQKNFTNWQNGAMKTVHICLHTSFASCVPARISRHLLHLARFLARDKELIDDCQSPTLSFFQYCKVTKERILYRQYYLLSIVLFSCLCFYNAPKYMLQKIRFLFSIVNFIKYCFSKDVVYIDLNKTCLKYVNQKPSRRIRPSGFRLFGEAFRMPQDGFM